MVAVEITTTGVEIDPLAHQSVHPAAELFPLMAGPEFDELVADIREHGQREPIVMTPSGQLLDGRNRWRACAKADVVPVTRVETSEPWAFVISTNVHRRHLTDSQRAMIGARIAERRNGQRGPNLTMREASSAELAFSDHPPPPTHEEAAALLNVSRASIKRARDVVKHGTKSLQQAAEQGAVPGSTAARVAIELSAEQQNEFVQRVKAGGDPRKLAPSEPARNRGDRGGETKTATGQSPRRHHYVNESALRHLRDSLDAVALVVASTPDGLDPSITSEEAARWLDGLSKAHGAYRRVVALLKERKDSIQ